MANKLTIDEKIEKIDEKLEYLYEKLENCNSLADYKNLTQAIYNLELIKLTLSDIIDCDHELVIKGFECEIKEDNKDN